MFHRKTECTAINKDNLENWVESKEHFITEAIISFAQKNTPILASAAQEAVRELETLEYVAILKQCIRQVPQAPNWIHSLQDKDGYTPLLAAIVAQDIDLAIYLVENWKANPNDYDKFGYNALDLIATHYIYMEASLSVLHKIPRMYKGNSIVISFKELPEAQMQNRKAWYQCIQSVCSPYKEDSSSITENNTPKDTVTHVSSSEEETSADVFCSNLQLSYTTLSKLKEMLSYFKGHLLIRTDYAIIQNGPAPSSCIYPLLIDLDYWRKQDPSFWEDDLNRIKRVFLYYNKPLSEAIIPGSFFQTSKSEKLHAQVSKVKEIITASLKKNPITEKELIYSLLLCYQKQLGASNTDLANHILEKRDLRDIKALCQKFYQKKDWLKEYGTFIGLLEVILNEDLLHIILCSSATCSTTVAPRFPSLYWGKEGVVDESEWELISNIENTHSTTNTL